jgi:aspartyl-tRNA(Asn)/glutamyl-tRNA(Gln) amidotransferase subunit C
MKIDDLRETAMLAHLNLDDAELAGAFPAFEQMLGFFAAMQAADEDRAAFPAPPAGPAAETPGSSDFSLLVYADHFRPDGNTRDSNTVGDNTVDGNTHDTNTIGDNTIDDNTIDNLSHNTASGLNENLLNNAGERDGRFIVVPNVL